MQLETKKEILTKYSPEGPERVGFILEDGELVEVANTSPEPEIGFQIDPLDLLKYETRATATWHTHPGAESNLSSQDYYGFMSLPELSHFIAGNDGVREFVVSDAGIVIERT